MGTPNDIFKLVERMKRAAALTERAAAVTADGDRVMNVFEQTLDQVDQHMTKIAEYGLQLANMLATTDNGGPPLDPTPAPAPAEVPTATSSSRLLPHIDFATGDPIRT
jgi:division protein CdvB (Snf7/Vps24/ESCRT-III family)